MKYTEAYKGMQKRADGEAEASAAAPKPAVSIDSLPRSGTEYAYPIVGALGGGGLGLLLAHLLHRKPKWWTKLLYAAAGAGAGGYGMHKYLDTAADSNDVDKLTFEGKVSKRQKYRLLQNEEFRKAYDAAKYQIDTDTGKIPARASSYIELLRKAITPGWVNSTAAGVGGIHGAYKGYFDPAAVRQVNVAIGEAASAYTDALRSTSDPAQARRLAATKLRASGSTTAAKLLENSSADKLFPVAKGKRKGQWNLTGVPYDQADGMERFNKTRQWARMKNAAKRGGLEAGVTYGVTSGVELLGMALGDKLGFTNFGAPKDVLKALEIKAKSQPTPTPVQPLGR